MRMQRRLEIARAMCSELVFAVPRRTRRRIEPQRIHRPALIHRPHPWDETRIGIMLIEHNMNVVMEISDHVVVLDYGKLISRGTPKEVRNDPGALSVPI